MVYLEPINIMNVYENLDLLSTQQTHLTMEYLSSYQGYLIH